jgi:hypothetical protein
MLRKSIASAAFSFIVLMLAAPAARAQIIYEPVQFQFIQHLPGGGSDTFYYGGHDPFVFAQAVLPIAGSMTRVKHTPLRVFTDVMPRTNAAIYGFAVWDAANEANANAARYFRKADVLRAKADVEGEMVVPAWAGSEIDQPPVVAAPAMVRITPSGPHPLMVIPIPQRLQSPGTILVVGTEAKNPALPRAQAATVPTVAAPVATAAASLPAS